jgi:hypothetical protein
MKTLSRILFLTLSLAAVATACSDKKSAKTFVQVDRMAIPTINTVLIPTASKDAFNDGSPGTDIASFRATGQSTITGLRNAVNGVSGFPAEDAPGISAADLAAVLIPDIVTIDFSKTVAFTNGRRLNDDVVDAAVGLVLNRGNVLGGGAGVSDGIDANDRTFSNTFPYLASPH